MEGSDVLPCKNKQTKNSCSLDSDVTNSINDKM